MDSTPKNVDSRIWSASRPCTLCRTFSTAVANHLHLPARMQMQFDFIDQHDTGAIQPGLFTRTDTGQLIKQIDHSWHERSVAVREFGRGQFQIVAFKKRLTVTQFVRQTAVLVTNQGTDDADDFGEVLRGF